ncbi:DNA topoisomerase-1 [Microbacterium endophyticum]|uniref:DNA topoisomerase n=1 Tax=Microbacterium endophyticum TaxID=1526412 RepID=A0A7W4YLZ7_9MICO|nr:DNA topoisomerase IB [Microbacterium endophyticum]MBB2975683.1 DNA topoisomerase-1 [Microbacterium endophyticum]NIK35298.1 DNA topoisomerase-1 [Microbacterium endophyticum]
MTRLRRSQPAKPGITRVRRGRGFGYVDVNGGALQDREIQERIASLVIPPAWRDVWIAPHANGHIQALGFDEAGRRQYIYHPAWRIQRDRVKFDRMLELAAALPSARRGVTIDIRQDGMTRLRVLAGAFRMLDTGSLRVGSERYADEHGSYGLSTLRGAHASVRAGEIVELRFPGKSGQAWESDIHDVELAELVARLKRRGGQARLLAWQEEGSWHPLQPEEINDDLRRRLRGDFTAKDFRTLHGTGAAAISLAKAGPQKSVAAQRRAVAAAMRDAADVLGNTPSIARSSYVDPRVLDRYERGETIDAATSGSIEAQLIQLLT